MIEFLAKRFPARRFEVISDAAYTNDSLIKGRPSNVTLIGGGRAWTRRWMRLLLATSRLEGPHASPGRRLLSPARRASRKDARWKKLEVTVYGRTVTVEVLVIDART